MLYRIFILMFAFAPFSMALGGCTEQTSVPEADLTKVIAKIGDSAITLGDLKNEEKRYKDIFTNQSRKAPVNDLEFKKKLLKRVIDNRILEIEADRQAITVSEDDLDNEINALLGEYDSARLGLVLAENEMDFDEWKEALAKRMKIRKLVIKQIDSKIKINESEIKEYFKENRGEFKWPERMRAFQIMVNDETTAEKIRKKLLNREDFATMAKEFSQSPDAVNGGDLGYFSRGQMPPEFEKAVFALKPGEISEVIKSIYGFHLFKVISKKKSRKMAYPEARERIRALLTDNKREKEFNNWVKKIKDDLSITVYQNALL